MKSKSAAVERVARQIYENRLEAATERVLAAWHEGVGLESGDPYEAAQTPIERRAVDRLVGRSP